MQVCFGNVAPDGVVFKVSSMEKTTFQGTALCFDDAREVAKAVEVNRIKPGMIIVLRYQGPVACGMPEVLVATAALAVPELDGKVAFLSDTRVSGVSHGAIGVHCSPEAAVGGPIAWVEDGDEIFLRSLGRRDQVAGQRRGLDKAPRSMDRRNSSLRAARILGRLQRHCSPSQLRLRQSRSLPGVRVVMLAKSLL